MPKLDWTQEEQEAFIAVLKGEQTKEQEKTFWALALAIMDRAVKHQGRRPLPDGWELIQRTDNLP